MIKQLLEAIDTKYRASHVSQLAGGYHATVRQGTATPYVVWTIGDGAPEWTMDRSFERLPVLFDIWDRSDSANAILDIREWLTTAFDEATLNVTGWTTIRLQRTNSGAPERDEMDKHWHIRVAYELYTQTA